jgi:hypothetical protein
MSCRLCGCESGTARPAGDRQSPPGTAASDPFGLTCSLCGASLPASQSAALLLEKLKQLAQFGLTTNVRLLAEPPGAEN